MPGDIQFEVMTPLGFSVRCTVEYWRFITTEKHPVLTGKEKEIVAALRDPDEVRLSRKDPAVYLFYKGGSRRWTCVVARKEDGSGFMVTAYPTDSIKTGETIWTKSK